jgi:hypothetical protein
VWFAAIPMVFVMAVTVVSLVLQIRSIGTAAVGTVPWINGLVGIVLMALTAVLVAYALRAWRRPAATVP